MTNILLISTVVVVIAVAYWLTRKIEVERRRCFHARFSGRTAIPFKSQIQLALQGQDSSDEECGWLEVARILKVDPNLLRTDDRFDGILAEDPAFPVEGEFHDLCDAIARSVSATDYDGQVRTLLDAATVLGKAKKA